MSTCGRVFPHVQWHMPRGHAAGARPFSWGWRGQPDAAPLRGLGWGWGQLRPRPAPPGSTACGHPAWAGVCRVFMAGFALFGGRERSLAPARAAAPLCPAIFSIAPNKPVTNPGCTHPAGDTEPGLRRCAPTVRPAGSPSFFLFSLVFLLDSRDEKRVLVSVTLGGEKKTCQRRA